MAIQKILIVDDEPDVCSLVARNLKKSSFEVETAGSGKELDQKLKTFKPDLMILDLYMPEINGMEIIQSMRNKDNKIAKFPANLLVMVMSGGADLESQEELESKGIRIIQKPIDFKALVNIIKEM